MRSSIAIGVLVRHVLHDDNVVSALTTDQKGVIAETAVVRDATRRGIGVARPIGPERYDLIFDLRPELVRVQCKWASLRGDVIAVRVVSARRTANGIAKRAYSADEIDAFAAYCPELDTCFFLPIARFAQTRAIQLRTGPCRNGQQVAVNWASDYAFDATLLNHLGP